MATSWQMSGEHRKALHELHLSEKEGASGWLFDFYYGRALNAVGRSMEAIAHLKASYSERGNRPDLLEELSQSYYDSGRFLTAAKYSFLSVVTGVPLYPKSAVRGSLRGISHFTIGVTCSLSKVCWKVAKYVPLIRDIQLRFLPPNEPEFTLGNVQIKKGNYETAEQKFRLSCNMIPNKAASRSNLALSLALQGKKNEALIECDKAVKLAPKESRFQHQREQIAKGNMQRIVDQTGNVVRTI